MSTDSLDPHQLELLLGLPDEGGGERSHAANIVYLDPLNSPQPLLLGNGEDGGEVLVEKLKLAEPQVPRRAVGCL